jgi:hypothetical protein
MRVRPQRSPRNNEITEKQRSKSGAAFDQEVMDVVSGMKTKKFSPIFSVFSSFSVNSVAEAGIPRA